MVDDDDDDLNKSRKIFDAVGVDVCWRRVFKHVWREMKQRSVVGAR